MSNNLAEYESADLKGNNHRTMSVNAFYGGVLGAAVQFTIGNHYAAISEKQVEHLIELLQHRLNKNTHAASSNDLDLFIGIDGCETFPREI